MNKVIKLVSVLVMVMMLATTFSAVCFATELDPSQIDGAGTAVGAESIKNIGGTIFKTIRNIAAILLVVLIAVLGVKYMMGSVEEKSDYKKSAIPLVVGVAVVLAASTIAGFVWDTFQNI